MDKLPAVLKIKRAYDGKLVKGSINNLKKERASDALVYFTEGKVEYSFDTPDGKKPLTASSGRVLYLPKSSRYYMNIIENSSFICVDFYFDTDEKMSPAVFKTESSHIGGDFERMIRSSLNLEPHFVAEGFSVLYSILSQCLKIHLKKYSRSKKLLSAAFEFITESYTDPELKAGDISDSVGVSEAHLRRLFREEGMPAPMKYVNGLRIKRAKNLLRNSNCPIAEVALLSGFNDPFYFSREFKKAVGVAPSKYVIY